MARHNEIECLTNVKNALSHQSWIKIYSNCELEGIKHYLFSAIPNSDSNHFPDFIFDGGGIEHFELTSSKTIKKGSQFHIEKDKNEKKNKEKFDVMMQEFEQTEFSPGTVYVSNTKDTYDNFSYNGFLYSLENRIVDHVKSLKKMNYHDKTIIFLMEQQTARMVVHRDSFTAKFYELHKDRKALNIIKEYCCFVDYIVYFVADSIEMIDLSKIDELISDSVVYDKVEGGRLVDGKLYFACDIKI